MVVTIAVQPARARRVNQLRYVVYVLAFLVVAVDIFLFVRTRKSKTVVPEKITVADGVQLYVGAPAGRNNRYAADINNLNQTTKTRGTVIKIDQSRRELTLAQTQENPLQITLVPEAQLHIPAEYSDTRADENWQGNEAASRLQVNDYIYVNCADVYCHQARFIGLMKR